tara:strand:+ start:160 stop:531 length:372 start_codon:yes stop_codon:yes gene_type:complete
MGRRYTGDIDGKFWFAVQDSDDADFFGVQGKQPDYLEYYFDKDCNLNDIKEGIEKCKKALGDWKTKLDVFFKKNEYSYNSKMLKDQINLTDETLLEWYARLDLGKKILNCVEEQGECSFEAEC